MRLFFCLVIWRGGRYDSRRLVMVTSSSEGTMMPLEMLLAIAWLRFFESVLLVTWLRWKFTVRSLMPSMVAISQEVLPSLAQNRHSFSRSDSSVRCFIKSGLLFISCNAEL